MTQPHHGEPPLNITQRLSAAVVGRLPVVLVRETERVMLNLATATVGLTSLLALREPGTIASSLSFPLLLVLWSVTLLSGGLMVIVGMTNGWRVVERAGLILTAVGCAAYASALFASDGIRARIIGILFLAIAATKLIRLVVSTAGSVAAAKGGSL